MKHTVTITLDSEQLKALSAVISTADQANCEWAKSERHDAEGPAAERANIDTALSMLAALRRGLVASREAEPVSLTKDEAAECLMLLDDLAAYALDGWVENGDMDAESEQIWSERLDTIRHKVGGKGSWNDDNNRRLRG